MLQKLLLGLAAVIALPLLILILLSTGTELKLAQPVRVVGAETSIPVQIDNTHGLRRLTAYLDQNGKRYRMQEITQPATRLLWKRNEPARTVALAVGTKQAEGLKDGPARLVVEAQSNDFRGAVDAVTQDVQINSQPPSVVADGHQHYINQGGSELVVFTVSGYWTEAGVRVGKYSFRSFPMPGQTSKEGERSERFAIFGYPWDVPADTVPVVYARNPTGAEATARFWFKMFPKQWRSRDLDLSDSFLQKVVNELDPQGSGDLVQRFVKINSEMRQENNRILAGLRLKSAEKVLWTMPFQQLGNSKVESQFADIRSYVYKGKKVDQQTHLGFDLSVTQQVPIVTSGDGVVVYGAPLGIYGNCVVVDHGYGLQSIYAHLSQIDVKPGDALRKGQVLGRSGQTGLAGGDHLHYSMQIDGVQINPVEWWDAHWIQDRILSKLPAPKE